VPYFGDAVAPMGTVLCVLLVVLLAIAIIMLGRGARLGPRALSVAVLMLIIAAAAALSDRALGYRVEIPKNLPGSAAVAAEEVARYTAALRQTVAAEPMSAEARYALGEAYYNLRQLDDAATALTDAFLLDPRHLKSRYLLELLFRTHSRNLADTDAAVAEQYLADPENPTTEQALYRMRAAHNLTSVR
jgi:cytochrome c-type biogenesis protein CcmH/NrfG